MQFVKHEDPEISRLSADLLADSHELSRIWKDKQTYVETEEMKLKEIVADAVLKFKSDKIIKLQKELKILLEEAQKANDIEKVQQLNEEVFKSQCCAWIDFQESWETGYCCESNLSSYIKLIHI